jgi:hypothetical protein
MWEPRHLTPIWAFTACYRDSFTLTLILIFLRDFLLFILAVTFTFSKVTGQDNRSLIPVFFYTSSSLLVGPINFHIRMVK